MILALFRRLLRRGQTPSPNRKLRQYLGQKRALKILQVDKLDGEQYQEMESHCGTLRELRHRALS